jgi:hypothetical protein
VVLSDKLAWTTPAGGWGPGAAGPACLTSWPYICWIAYCCCASHTEAEGLGMVGFCTAHGHAFSCYQWAEPRTRHRTETTYTVFCLVLAFLHRLLPAGTSMRRNPWVHIDFASPVSFRIVAKDASLERHPTCSDHPQPQYIV